MLVQMCEAMAMYVARDPYSSFSRQLITIRIIAFCRYQCLLVHIFHSSIAFLSASSSYSAHICLEELSVVPYQWVISGSRGDTINRIRMYAGQGKGTHLFHNLHTSSKPFVFTQVLLMPRL